MDFVSFFSGRGAIDLGLERAGWRPVAQVELDASCRRVLGARYPEVPKFEDITAVRADEIPEADAYVGGFPCQDNSQAHSVGERRFIDGPRSGLWWTLYDLACWRRPRWLILENVPNLWRRWLPDVRAALAGAGYASLPMVLRAGSFGAPHVRPRLVLVANANGDSEPLRAIHEEVARLRPLPVRGGNWRAPPPRGFRVDDGTADGMERCGMIGNSACPEVFEWLGREISRLHAKSSQEDR